MIKQYTNLDIPSDPMDTEGRPVDWNQSSPFSHKTVPEFWHEDTVYLYGIDLFNHHFFWESHEVWERKWNFFKIHHAEYADWMQGMIQTAAAFVKAVEKNASGFEANRQKAILHLRAYQSQDQIMGINPQTWIAMIQDCSFETVSLDMRTLPKIKLTTP